MATPGQPIEMSHRHTAERLLDDLKPITDDPGGDAQVRATAAVAHAVLALPESAASIFAR